MSEYLHKYPVRLRRGSLFSKIFNKIIVLRYIIPLVLFISLVVVLAVGLKRDPRLVPSPFIGRPAPELNLPTLKDPSRRITRQDLLGKVTLVNIWASWCGACRDEHEILLRLAKENGARILGFDYKDQREDALAWLKRMGDPYVDVVTDTDGRVGIEWGVYGVPETFLVDQEGVIRFKQIGALGEESVATELLPLMQKLQSGAAK